MEPSIGKTYLFLPTATDIWEALAQTYSKKGTDAQLYELRCKLHETKQKGLSVTAYYNTLGRQWQELDLYHPFQMESATDTAKL